MKTNVGMLGALFAVMASGCAGTSVVPLQPLAQGVQVDGTSYDLTVEGRPGGRVLFTRGQAIRDARGQSSILIGMQVDNLSNCRTYHLPSDQIYVSNLGGRPVKLVEVDHQRAPGAIDVAPGESKNVDLTFVPVGPFAKRDLDRLQVQWTLLIDGAVQPVVRATPFARFNSNLVADRRRWSAQSNSGYPYYDLPATDFFRGGDTSTASGASAVRHAPESSR